MKKWTFLLCLLAACGSNPSTDTAALVSTKQLIAMSNDTLPIAHSLEKLTKQDRERLYRHYPSTLEKIDEREPLNVQDIKNLTRAGVTDEAIIYEIHATRSVFYLLPDDEQELTQAGVSMQVLNEMKHTAESRY